MGNAGYAMPVLEAQEAKATAQAFGLEAARLEIWRSEDIAPAFEAIKGKADALYVVSDALIAANRTLITTLALSARLPTMLSYGDYVAAGGLMSYGPNYRQPIPAGCRHGRQNPAWDEARCEVPRRWSTSLSTFRTRLNVRFWHKADMPTRS
jgi:hypothetical protein